MTTTLGQSKPEPPADYHLRGTDIVTLMPEALERAGEWLRHELSKPGSCFKHKPRQGFSRGIEFYSGYDLLQIMAWSLGVYTQKVGCWPNVISPAKYTEKLIWMKFFSYLPVPTVANKLTVGSFIPERYRARIQTAKVLWRSTRPAIPALGEVPPGKHFLKANNASGYNVHLQFPVPESLMPQLRQRIAQMFERPRAVSGGEWWYAFMQPEIFVEREIDSPENLEEWKFFVANGKCLSLFERTGSIDKDGAVITLYDRDFNHLDVGIRDLPMGDPRDKPAEFETMLDAAEEIASTMPFARVDFYRTTKGKLFLGEITLCPQNAANWYTKPWFDLWMGENWQHDAQYHLDTKPGDQTYTTVIP